MSRDSDRRQFLRQAFAGTATVAAVTSRPWSTLFAAEQLSPNEKLDIACLGVAAQGNYNITHVASENIVALCDIDQKRLAKAAETFPSAEKFTDYRKMLDKIKVDAVVVSTPDHSHAIPTIQALQRGFDVYCEKPLAHTVWEVRQMRQWAKKQNAVTQMGTQIHAEDNYRRAVEIVQSGILGPVRRVHVWKKNSVPALKLSTTTGLPPHVNYDLWLGPAPEVAYDENRFHFNWRYWWNFGGGTLGDFGCHYMDLPFWALDLVHPDVVEADGEKTYEGDNQVPDSLRVDYRFPARGEQPPVHLTWYHGSRCPSWIAAYEKQGADGVLFEGDAGRLLADYGTHRIYTNDGPTLKAPEPTIPSSIGHHQEWIAACKSRGPTTCNFNYSGALTEAVLLGNVSYRAGKRWLEWDAENLRVTNCPEANEFIRREYRPGWTF